MNIWTRIKNGFGTTEEIKQADSLPSTFAPTTPPNPENTVSMSLRPTLDTNFLDSQIGTYPRFWARYDEFDRFVKTSDIMRIIINARKREIFRNGFAIKNVQGTEVTGLPPTPPEVDTPVVKRNKDAQKDLIESFIRQANSNDQTLKEVLKELEEDFCTFDDAYLACQFEYEVDDKGVITAKFAKEFFRMHPANMRILTDKRNRMGRDRDGNKIYFSINNRTTIITEDEAKRRGFLDRQGCRYVQAFYQFVNNAGQTSSATGNVYYAQWEVKHASQWNASLTYSTCPPILSIWMKIWTLIKMDQYVMQNYALQRPPKFFLVFNTTNSASLEKAYQQMIQRAKTDPHTPGILANESKDSTGSVQVVDLMRSLEEMQYTETRQEYRTQIGMVFGVLPLWHGDVSTSGGLNNEGMQITVTNREMEDTQGFYNEKFLSFVTRCIGCTDFSLTLHPNEELDEVAVLQRQAMKIQNASAMRGLGLTVQFDSETGEFTYSGTVSPAAPNPFNGMNGGDGFNNSLPETGFQKKSEFSGTTDDEVAQADKGGSLFQSPAASGVSKQSKSTRQSRKPASQ